MEALMKRDDKEEELDDEVVVNKEILTNGNSQPAAVVKYGCPIPCATVAWFTVFAAIITAVQGIYLGYTIGVLTTIEKRFEIPSAWSGGLLSVYDVGHAISVLLVGHYGSRLHQPKWVAAGAVLSSVACFGLFLPHLIFGEYRTKSEMRTFLNVTTASEDEEALMDSLGLCRWRNQTAAPVLPNASCLESRKVSSNQWAYMILALFQMVAGIASSPFTTLTYVYVDDNSTRKQSPFYMGVISAMWAYGPALGFGLSSYTTQLWINLGEPPAGLAADSPDWMGSWWLGLIILCILYLLAGIPFLFYPKSLKRKGGVNQASLIRDETGDVELMTLRDLTKANSVVSRKSEHSVRWCIVKLGEIPMEIFYLVRNPMFTTMTMSWVAAAYLFGGYSTFLPKYLEVIFHQPTFLANILGGIVAVVGVATSTAIGGKVLTWLNPKAPKALMFVVVTFVHSLLVFILLMFVSCDGAAINGLLPEQIQSLIGTNNFSTPTCLDDSNRWASNETCTCSPLQYSPICDRGSGQSYYSPCYLGCGSPKNETNGGYENCICATGAVDAGLCGDSCTTKLALYLLGSFIGGSVGAFFQMALFTNLMWAVPKEKKTNAVALSNFFMSVFGFIPSQVLFGKLFDSTCVSWSVDANSSCESGYCLLYDNRLLRIRFHAATAAFQFVALAFVFIGHFVSRNFPFPEHDEDDDREQSADVDRSLNWTAITNRTEPDDPRIS